MRKYYLGVRQKNILGKANEEINQRARKKERYNDIIITRGNIGYEKKNRRLFSPRIGEKNRCNAYVYFAFFSDKVNGGYKFWRELVAGRAI